MKTTIPCVTLLSDASSDRQRMFLALRDAYLLLNRCLSSLLPEHDDQRFNLFRLELRLIYLLQLQNFDLLSDRERLLLSNRSQELRHSLGSSAPSPCP